MDIDNNGQQCTTMDSNGHTMDNNWLQYAVLHASLKLWCCFLHVKFKAVYFLFLPNLKVSTFNFEIFAFYAQHISNVYQMCIFQIFYKCFTNLFQMSNLSFFVNSRDKLIHFLVAFSLRNISIAINHCFSVWSISRNTKGECDSSYIYIWLLHILTAPSRSCQIFRSSHIPIDLESSWQILADLDRSQQILTDLRRSCKIFPNLHISQ